MIVLGSYLAQSDIKKMFTSPQLYLLSLVRLLMIPAVTLIVFRFIPVRMDIIMTAFIALSTPIGANVAVYAQLYNKDYPYACQTVAITTLLSIFTLPLMLMAADLVL
jgi:predicted permease